MGEVLLYVPRGFDALADLAGTGESGGAHEDSPDGGMELLLAPVGQQSKQENGDSRPHARRHPEAVIQQNVWVSGL